MESSYLLLYLYFIFNINMNNPTLIITTAFQTWIQAHKELSHLKKYQGRRGHVNPKLWTPELTAAASSIEVRRLMYLMGDIHKMSMPDHKTGGSRIVILKMTLFCCWVSLRVLEDPAKFSYRVTAPVRMQDSMQQAHTGSGNEAAAPVLALTCEHLSHRHCGWEVGRQE